MPPQNAPGELVPGTLDLLILRTLRRGPMHGYGIAETIKAVSEDVLRVEEGSLYPALHRLEVNGYLASGWGVSTNNRRAKFYRLTRAGHHKLAADRRHWSRLAAAMDRVMEMA